MTVGQRLADLRWMIANCRPCGGSGQCPRPGTYPYTEHGQGPPPIPTDLCLACHSLRSEHAALSNMQVVPR